MHIRQNYQREFFENFFMDFELDENNELIRIEKELPWDELCEVPGKYYSHSQGRPTKPSRAKIGLLILKHLYGLSDEELVKQLKGNLHYQYFCDLSPKRAQNFIDPSSLAKFRKTIGLEGIREIDDIVDKTINTLSRKGKRGPKNKHLIMDTTVAMSPIEYPTDVKLLEKCRRKCVEVIDKAKKYGVDTIFRTYKRIAKKVVDTHQKLGHHTTKVRRKIQKKLLGWVNRNVKQVEESQNILKKKLTAVTDTLKKKVIDRFIDKTAKTLKTIKNILVQQKEMYRGKKIKDRIVSVWNDKIRPIVRGKYPNKVEFGPKILLVKKGKFLHLAGVYFDNVNDAQLFDPALDYYKEKWKEAPNSVSTDKGFYSKKNVQRAREEKIKYIAIQKKGKSAAKEKDSWRKIFYCLRCSIEAKISLAKRKFGMSHIKYRIDGAEEMWIRLGLMAMNLKMAVNTS